MFQVSKLGNIGLVCWAAILTTVFSFNITVAQEGPAPDSDLPVLSLNQCLNLAMQGNPSLMISWFKRKAVVKAP